MSQSKSSAALIKNITLTILVVLLKAMKWTLIFGVILCFFIAGAGIGYVGALVQGEPVREKEDIIAKMQENTETSFVYFRDGTMIGQLRTDVDRRIAELNEIPPHIVDALLAVEDDRFYEHIGVDLGGILRAVKQRVLNEPTQTGGSTITQQVARNVFLSAAREDSRKAREIFLAMRIERFMSKDEILQAYLNKVPFGKGSSGYNVYGIKAAAEGIFGVKDLHELHLAQAAYLVGLPQAPSAYSAFTSTGEFDAEGFEKAVKRQRHVLERMQEENFITREEYEEALEFDLRSSLAETQKKAYSTYPFLMIEIERRAAKLMAQLENPELTEEDLEKEEYAELLEFKRKELSTGGYRIYTTIDKTMYDRMQAIARNPDNFAPDHEEKGVEQIGAVMLDNDTGEILAMMPGRGFQIEQLNHATQMVRQPGSTMKPIAAFLPALESGDIQPASIIDDIPLVLEDGSKGYHIPNNWDLRFHGLMTARRALNQSYNVPALKLFNEVVGIENAWAFARKLGITTLTEEDAYARTGVIGGLKYGTSVEELTNAYSAIANKGRFNDAFMISRIENSEGQIVYEHRTAPETVFSEQTAFLMTDMLRTVIESGTATLIKRTFEHYGEVPVVGKTGSTQFDRDAWFIGFSPDITVGVWAGYDNNKPLTLYSNLPQGPGTQRAMRIWAKIMDSAIELNPEWFETGEFTRPDGIVRMTVSAISGKLPSPQVRQAGELVTDWFDRKHVPTEEDDHLVRMKVVQYKGRNWLPNPSTPESLIREKLLIKREEPIYEILDRIEELLASTPAGARPKINGRPATVRDYYPEDLERTAPTETDPRVDDGNPPAPPTGLELIELEGQNKITFRPSESEDVLSYRFYRSMNGGNFQARPGQSVMSGEDLVIYDYVSEQYDYAYYITAVDIAGRESAPSAVLFTDAESETEFPTPGMPPGGPTDIPGDQNDPETGNETDDETDSPNGETDPASSNEGAVPSPPRNVEAELADGGLSVQISWQANPFAERVEKYDIYYSDSADGQFRKIGSSNSTRFKYIAVPAEGWYRVVAVNEAGESDPSAAVELKNEEE